MTVTNIEAFIGEPGTGKTYQLTHMVNDLINQGESIYIMNPTKSARNNVRKAFKEMLEIGEMSYNNYKEAFKSTNVLRGYQDNPSNNIFIDESAMIDLSAFYALLYATIGMEDVHIYLFGDMKQIEPVNGDSILKTLIEKTMPSDDTRNIWQYVADTLYSDMENITVDSPEAWKLDSKVNITVFKKNYRLQSKNFDGYDDEYYEDLIDGAIFSDDYSGYLKYALEHNWLITSPTNARGDEIDNMLRHKYDDFKTVAPFVVDGKGDYYLNPFNQSFNQLKESFDFMPQIEKETAQDYVYTAYMSTHRVQSFTVDNVLFYLGNNPIANRHKSHYSNNLLYTAISRARFDVQILGLPESFQQMHETMPLTAQQKNVHLKAGVAIVNLKKWVGEADYTPLADEIYDKYVDLYNDNSLLSAYEKSLLEIYKIDSKIYNKRYVIDYINNNFEDKFGFTLTVWLKENASEAQKGNSNAKGKGKIKQWIDSLSDDEIETLKSDLKSRLVKKNEFESKYNYTKEQVRKAFK